MESQVNQTIKKLLNYEFDDIINKLGFDDVQIEKESKVLIEAIGLLDNITIKREVKDKSSVITLVALLWTLYGRKYFGLRDILMKMLARIGYLPSSIIMDSCFDRDNQQFSGLNSIINEISINFNQDKYEISILGEKFLLTDFQKEVCELFDNNDIIGISAPTSAGKSFTLTLKSVELLINQSIDIVYIVPTLSLVTQVSEDYKKMLKKFKFKHYEILNSYDYKESSTINKIYVLTQEKAISVFSNEDKPFKSDIILIVDEIQNLERVGNDNDTRSKILFDTIFEFRNHNIIKKAIISGPRIEEIDILSNNLFGVDNAKKIETTVSPVLNLTYSINKIKNNYYLKQYCSLFNEPLIRKIKNDNIIVGYSQKKYDDKFLDYLYTLIDKFGELEQNIIFAPTSKTARNISLYISEYKVDKCCQEIDTLIQYYEETVHPEYSLCVTLKKMIAYHHGKLPAHVRRTIEKAATSKLINNLVCTTTLMQGVNLPVQNIFIRNPHLYINKNKDSAELSSYEMTNLRGRAGRLLKDFIGRTFVLDESEFSKIEDDYNQIDIFGEITKEIGGNYESTFLEYEVEIKNSLNDNSLVSEINSKFGYLVTYIRQTILKDVKNAYDNLNKVGIKITKDEVNKLSNELSKLKVPKKICLKNRYWDPIILDSLYNEKLPDLPQKPIERGNQTKLRNVLKFLRDNPKYKSIFEKYIPKAYRSKSGLTKVCKLATKWVNQVSLKEILNKEKHNDNISDSIEENIMLLQNTISYGIPLLLSPIYDIKFGENIYLTYMETGAFKPISRKMIEMGVPRETALYINDEYCADISISETENLHEIIINKLKNIYDQLPYWIAVQIEHLI